MEMDNKKEKSKIALMEEGVLAQWEKEKTFEKIMRARKKGKPFVFYEGPPTANGMPHPGHVMGRCFKDLFLRYKTMKGYWAPRRAGWDTHGLPVEIEVEKRLGFRAKSDIEKMGAGEFNRLCKESVWKYKDEWERVTKRIGFWLDMERPYITYENDYIESLWWVIGRIFQKGLLVEDYKVTPYCTRCGTGLSSHEIAQGYKIVKEKSLFVKFRARREKPTQEDVLKEKARNGIVFDDGRAAGAREYFVAWTTTPWTLPANVALAVNPDLEYVRARKGDEVFIIANACVQVLGEGWEIIQSLKGSELAGLEYEQLFSYVQPDAKAFFVVAEEFVSADEGSGIVHIAPAYGEDDMAAAKRHGLPVVHTVKENGEFCAELPWQGMFVKRADPLITETLQKRGLLLKEELYEHEYPFCWRCDTPLLYFARKSWFVKMSLLKNELRARNEKINWVPSHIKEGRFGEWLKEAKDWAFSRERYWGTPLPIWRCEACGQTEAVESIAGLSERSKLKNRYFIMRHGEALYNTKNLCDSSGNPKNKLTQKGKEQIIRSIARFEKTHPDAHIDIIIASPLARAQETARIAADAFGVPQSAIIVDSLIREISVGIFDGKKIGKYHGYYSSLEEKFTAAPPEGESLHDAKKRLARFMRETELRYEGKTILAVSHEYPVWIMESMCAGLTDAETVCAKKKRRGDYIKTGEIRELRTAKLPLDADGNVDLHKPYIDDMVFSCAHCSGMMRRIPEVADVWFDSGCMPFAQMHFPFAHIRNAQFAIRNISIKKLVRYIPYPADFICEGVDQTRGWFYTLLAVSATLNIPAPYRNVISLGHILDKEGKKMSKSKRNYTDPMEIADRYGIDALRWYFFTANSAGEPKRFNEKDVADVQRKSVMALLNILQFLHLYTDMKRHARGGLPLRLKNTLDQWIVSRLQRTTQTANFALDRYDSLLASRTIAEFLDDLTNWFVRRSRERFQLRENKADYQAGAATLRHVYETTTKLIAPFMPFVTEHIWRALKKKRSVHAEEYPSVETKRIDKRLEYDMMKAREIVSFALAARAKAGVKVRQPLQTLFVKEKLSKFVRALVQEEVNVKEIREDIALNEIARLDVALTPALREEGAVRDIIRNIQQTRKEAGFQPRDRVTMRYAGDEKALRIMGQWGARIRPRIGAKRMEAVEARALKKPHTITCEGVIILFEIKK